MSLRRILTITGLTDTLWHFVPGPENFNYWKSKKSWTLRVVSKDRGDGGNYFYYKIFLLSFSFLETERTELPKKRFTRTLSRDFFNFVR